MVQLTPLEADILGDMACDSHGVGEIVGFIRSANPYADDFVVFRLTRELLDSWIQRGWLDLAPEPRPQGGLRGIEELLPLLDQLGPRAVSLENYIRLPEIDLTNQAFHDVEWLRGAV